MKKLLLFAASFAGAAVLAGSALAGHRPTTVTVAMHDPGCHSFLVGARYLQGLVTAGPVSLHNVDIAALKVMGPGGMRLVPVRKSVALHAGRYRITMVGQAPDDNTWYFTD